MLIFSNEGAIMITTILEIIISWCVGTETIGLILLTVFGNYDIGLYK